MSENLDIAITIKTLIAQDGVHNSAIERFIADADSKPTSNVLNDFNNAVSDYQTANTYDTINRTGNVVLDVYSDNKQALSKKAGEMELLEVALEDMNRLHNDYAELEQALEEGSIESAITHAYNIQNLLQDRGYDNKTVNAFIQDAQSRPSKQTITQYNSHVEELRKSNTYDSIITASESLIEFYNAHNENFESVGSEISLLEDMTERLKEVNKLMNELQNNLENNDGDDEISDAERDEL